ncbi:prepilin-type N-terminal cleavage/methylation domain-containing protein [Candidatus Sumerlaeota bacterium]|nr:prepilin-type N-terminal cleavage/methylation domain-containing protein [Candidatus Sumerlaeota bacterium]
MRTPPAAHHRFRIQAFTLIELLIVVAIIAILAAIAVPNFLEAQVRAKVSRVKADMRSIATAIESYRVDNGEYPEGSDEPDEIPQELVDLLGPLAGRYYTFRTRGPNGQIAGISFFTLTTPISYMTSIPPDPFASSQAHIPFCYRDAKVTLDGWILTSVGPDNDLLTPTGAGNANTLNPLSTAADPEAPGHIGDINERVVIHFIEGDNPDEGGNPVTYDSVTRSKLDLYLEDLTYDPTNGSISDGDIYRKTGTPKDAP